MKDRYNNNLVIGDEVVFDLNGEVESGVIVLFGIDLYTTNPQNIHFAYIKRVFDDGETFVAYSRRIAKQME